MTGTIQNIENEEYYKLVADNINDLVALYSVDGSLEYVSPSVYRLLGYSEADVAKISIIDVIHPDDRHLLNRTFAAKGGNAAEVIVFEYRLLHKNGTWIYFESYRKPIRDTNGTLVSILAVCRNISSRKQAEKEVRENEEHYRMLADNIIDMVAVYKIDGTCLYVSPSCNSLLGFTPEELTGYSITHIVHPDDMEKIRRDIRNKAFKGQEKFIIDVRFGHKGGQWLYCETTTKAIRDAQGKVVTFVATTRDITEWRNAQIALKESEEKYRSLVESSEAMISIVDKDCRFLFANDRRADFFETTKEDIIGKTIDRFYNTDNADSFNQKVQKVFSEKENYVYEARVMMAGKEFWLRVNMHPVLDSEGEVKAIMVNTTDITKSKETEEALRKQNEELKQIAFLQSHIVRSPLTNIQGIIALIEEETLSEENLYYMGLLKQATDKLDSIIKEIVDRAVAIRHQTKDL